MKVQVLSPDDLSDEVREKLGLPPREPDFVETKPAYSGPGGRAWRIDLAKVREKSVNVGNLTEDCAVAEWLIEHVREGCPHHTFLVYLGDLSGAEGKMFIEGATHELSITPLKPTGSRDAMLVGDQRPPVIENLFFLSHLAAGRHETAITMVQEAIKDVCAGLLKIDETDDSVRAWIDRFGDNGVQAMPSEVAELHDNAKRYMEVSRELEILNSYSLTKHPEIGAPASVISIINNAKLCGEGLAQLLMDKGVITKAEYVKACADNIEESYKTLCGLIGTEPKSFS